MSHPSRGSSRVMPPPKTPTPSDTAYSSRGAIRGQVLWRSQGSGRQGDGGPTSGNAVSGRGNDDREIPDQTRRYVGDFSRSIVSQKQIDDAGKISRPYRNCGRSPRQIVENHGTRGSVDGVENNDANATGSKDSTQWRNANNQGRNGFTPGQTAIQTANKVTQSGYSASKTVSPNKTPGETKHDLRVVTTSIESCRRYHRQVDCHPATLLFKTYGVLASAPESPDRDVMAKKGSRDFLSFDLYDRRAEVYLRCYFLESERRLPDICVGQTYTVVGHFMWEEEIGEFKVLTINQAMSDNGVRQNLFNYIDHKMRIHLMSEH